MRRFYSFCAISVTSFFASSVLAQPSTQSEIVRNPSQVQQRRLRPQIAWNEADKRAQQIQNQAALGPANAAARFLTLVRTRNWQQAAFYVAGVDETLPQFQKMASLTQDITRIHDFHVDLHAVQKEDERVNAQEGNTVEVSVPVVSRDYLDFELLSKEIVTLRREPLSWPKGLAHEAGTATVWRIVPPKIAALAKHTADEAVVSPGIIATYAQLVANPDWGVSRLGAERAMQKGKQLAIGMLQFVQDNDGKFDMTAENVREQLMPYVKSLDVFTAPGDTEGSQSFQLNPALAGKRIADINEVEKTVLFYLSNDEKPDFHYAGLTPVVYVDGHVKMMAIDTLHRQP